MSDTLLLNELSRWLRIKAGKSLNMADTALWTEWAGAADRASRTPEPVGVPAGYFIDTSAPGQPPHYEQVAAEHSQDPDAVPLYATHPVVAEQQGQPEQPPSGHVAGEQVERTASEEEFQFRLRSVEAQKLLGNFRSAMADCLMSRTVKDFAAMEAAESALMAALMKSIPAPLPIPLQGADEELMLRAHEQLHRIVAVFIPMHDGAYAETMATMHALRARLQPKGKDGQGGIETEDCRCPMHGSWIAADDIHRNVKALDVALNGVGGASRPLLIDVLSQVELVAAHWGMPVLTALAVSETTKKD